MDRSYFDYNSTAPVAPEIAAVYLKALQELPGNPSSIHRYGQNARQGVESARRTLATVIGASATEIVFTSGGTESNNLAILGIVPTTPCHVITTTIEHPAVLEPCRELARQGVDISYAGVDNNGVVDPEQVRKLLRKDTVLVSVMHANNEVGTIQPLREIADVIREHRLTGAQTWFHADGVQACGKIPVNVAELGVDLYSVSAHKVSAPKGVGALYVRKRTPLRAIQFGGRHERERRAGTENVAGAVSFAAATQLPPIDSSLRDRFEQAVIKALPEVQVNSKAALRLPNTSNLLFPGISGQSLVIALDLKGFGVSTGSACSSGSIEPSHVLLAMGLSDGDARSCLRFSFGRFNTIEQTDALIKAVVESVQQSRRIAPARDASINEIVHV